MVSLGSTVAQFGSVLLLDAAPAGVHAGLLQTGQAPRWAAGGDDAGVHLFAAVTTVLDGTGLKPGQVGAYVICDGPGSQLGIRTACMAVRTWQTLRTQAAPVFGYRSLVVAAKAGLRKRADDFAVIADARRDSWHAVRGRVTGECTEVLRASSAEVLGWPEPLLQPTGFRHWSKPPRETEDLPYHPEEIWAALENEAVLFPMDAPAPWQSAIVAYQTWSGERHRGPVAAQEAAQQ